MTSTPQRARHLLANVATGVVALAAVAVTGMAALRVAGQQRGAGTVATGLAAPRLVPDWRALAQIGRHLGDSTAPVRVIEFADYECPYCAVAAPTLDSAMRAASSRFSVSYVHFPLTAIHADAFAAAVAAECAAQQRRFAAYHERLYQNRRALRTHPWARLAQLAGVPNLGAFQQCLGDPESAAAVRAGLDAGARLGIRATPTFVVDGLLYPAGTAVTELLPRAARGTADPGPGATPLAAVPFHPVDAGGRRTPPSRSAAVP